MVRKIKVLGFRPFNFVGKDGNNVLLKEVHYSYNDEHSVGTLTGYVSLTEDTIKRYNLELNKEYNANFYFDTGKKKFVLVDIG